MDTINELQSPILSSRRAVSSCFAISIADSSFRVAAGPTTEEMARIKEKVPKASGE